MTNEVSALRFTFKDDHKRSLVLIDTPGFDDTDYLARSDEAILEDIKKALKTLYVLSTSSHNIIHAQQRGSGLSSSKGRVSGIFYLHRITDIRMSAAALTNMDMFQKLGGGEEIFRRVTLITTMWPQPTDPGYAECERREKEFTSDNKYWGLMSLAGSPCWRFTKTLESAQQIINEVVRVGRQDQKQRLLTAARSEDPNQIPPLLQDQEISQRVKTLEDLINTMEQEKAKVLEEMHANLGEADSEEVDGFTIHLRSIRLETEKAQKELRSLNQSNTGASHDHDWTIYFILINFRIRSTKVRA
jgi:hypothetical protein